MSVRIDQTYTDPPDWLLNYLETGLRVLALQDWLVVVKRWDWEAEEGTLADCWTAPHIRQATIRTTDLALQERGEAEHIIAHELAHVRLADLCDSVIPSLISQLAPAAHDLAGDWYKAATETAVEGLAGVIRLAILAETVEPARPPGPGRQAWLENVRP